MVAKLACREGKGLRVLTPRYPQVGSELDRKGKEGQEGAEVEWLEGEEEGGEGVLAKLAWREGKGGRKLTPRNPIVRSHLDGEGLEGQEGAEVDWLEGEEGRGE